MAKVKACKSCGIMVEMNAVNDKDGSKIPLVVLKCPLCKNELTEDDSENFEE